MDMKTNRISGLSCLGARVLRGRIVLVLPLIAAAGCQFMNQTVETVQTKYHQYTDEPPLTTATPVYSNKVDTIAQSARDPVLMLDKPPAIPAPVPQHHVVEKAKISRPVATPAPIVARVAAKPEPVTSSQTAAETVPSVSTSAPAKSLSTESRPLPARAIATQPEVTQESASQPQQAESSTQALVVKGTPQPRRSFAARFPLLIVSGAMLAGMCSLVGWSFYKRQNPGPIAMGPARDELLAAPGLTVKECASAREVIRTPEDSFTGKR
jgi:hypothetical protein